MTIAETRKTIFNRDGNKCHECGATKFLCLDLFPKPLKELHSIDNLLTLCWRCNFLKGTKILSDQKFHELYYYIWKANRRFTLIEKIEMNETDAYFRSAEGRYKKTGKLRSNSSLAHYEAFMKTKEIVTTENAGKTQ